LQKITIKVGDKEVSYDFSDFDASYDFEAAVDEALEFSESGGFFANLRKKKALKSKPLEIYADFVWNEAALAEIAEKIEEKYQIAPIEPTYSIIGGQFEIKPGKAGHKIDQNALKGEITAILQTKSDGVIAPPLIEIQPKLSYDDFAKSRELLGSFATPFDTANSGRAANLKTANNFLNNQVILPGETISVCTILRPRTAENGYVEAGQITGGIPDTGIGGGICQISSTLYMAALHAEMTVVQRQNHSLMVAYMQPATDATIAEGLIDLKLKNNTAYPMLIQSTLENHRHTINIFGNESRPKERQIRFESILIKTIPAETNFVECPILPPGASQIMSFGIDGSKYELYKIVSNIGPDGRPLSEERVKINTSSYRPLNAVVRIGVQPSNLAN
jgi:vancomycin resistance protein YoaR